MNSLLFFFTLIATCSLSAVSAWSASPTRYPKHLFTQLHESVAIDGVVSIAGETEPENHDVDPLKIHNNLEQDIVTPFDIARRKVSDVLEQSLRPENFSKEKLFNALLLTASFGFAGYTILNIDSGMTRGWTQNEIAMRIPLDNWNNYETSLAEKPIYTKTMINVIIYLLGDWLSQTIFQKKNLLDFDAGRTLRNGFIGLCFGPLVHEYYQFSDTILPLDSPNPLLTRVEKIVMDQTIYLSVKASIYVAAVALLAGESVETAKTNVKERIVGIVTTAWKFWPLVHCLTYTVVPAQHRILWVNCVDLFWNAILASMTGAKSNNNTNGDAVQAEEAMQANDLSSAMLLKQELVSVNKEDSLFFVNSTGTTLPTSTLLNTNSTVEVTNGEKG
ncbi:protein Mpv17 [Fistulifera solaris]|uniref:Protein Mpv17 n=1 Tax=Fistulifera solaris TaxID=1519565 RepID=A0A1Z5KF20_FISSO|nr:protein Mpv17 [Fistulifera solaris]|eukprot:GAX24839.1 protein Mpv17 [Fistulifera solaris]